MKLTLLALCTVLLGVTAPALAQEYSGTWTLEHSSDAGMVQLGLRYQHTTTTGNEEWDESRSVPWSDLRGVTSADLDSAGVQRSFSIVHDAGTFAAQGSLSRGHGAGLWVFQPSTSFNSQLSRRGIGAADTKQQFELAMSDFKFSTLDSLLSYGFERPSVTDLVSMVEHGVSDRYIQEMRGLGLRPNSAQSLIRMRDHGVGSEFAATVMRAYPGTTVEKLVELRDHGVGTSYIQEIAKAGLRVSAEDLIRMRDHGVSSDFATSVLRAFPGTSMDTLVELRDHGIGSSYMQEMAKLGLRVSPEDLIRLRDHGVSASFIERLRSHGYTKLSVDDLIRLRDSGF